MGQQEIEEYLNHMADKRRVSASTQAAALNAIAFLYREVLKTEMPNLEKLRNKTLSDNTGCDVNPRGCGDVG